MRIFDRISEEIPRSLEQSCNEPTLLSLRLVFTVRFPALGEMPAARL